MVVEHCNSRFDSIPTFAMDDALATCRRLSAPIEVRANKVSKLSLPLSCSFSRALFRRTVALRVTQAQTTAKPIYPRRRQPRRAFSIFVPAPRNPLASSARRDGWAYAVCSKLGNVSVCWERGRPGRTGRRDARAPTVKLRHRRIVKNAGSQRCGRIRCLLAVMGMGNFLALLKGNES